MTPWFRSGTGRQKVLLVGAATAMLAAASAGAVAVHAEGGRQRTGTTIGRPDVSPVPPSAVQSESVEERVKRVCGAGMPTDAGLHACVGSGEPMTPDELDQVIEQMTSAAPG